MNQQELRELENRCIQEHAPACTSACPIHVDVRGFISALQQEDFTGGLKVLRKTMPFPGIISHLCHQPCQLACKRNEAGDPIEIASLEQACVLYGDPGEAVKALPSKPKHAAIIGGGLSGMTAAFDLRRKGYQVSIFEAGRQLGGSLWDIPPEKLPQTILEQEIGYLEALGVEVYLDAPISKVRTNGNRSSLASLCDEYDVVFLATGVSASETFGLQLDSSGGIEVDPLTYMTSQPGVFAGGSMLLSRAIQPPPLGHADRAALKEGSQSAGGTKNVNALPEEEQAWRSVIYSVMDGRRAAVSMDRYLQKVSLNAARINEGPYTTRLFTNMDNIPSLMAVEAANWRYGYSKQEAVEEANRCILCECMECVKVCEYLKHYGGYPKKYIREIYNNLSIVMGTRYSNQFINSCSLCGLCGSVCPEDLDMGTVCRESRQLMVQQKRMPPSAHDFALRDMAFSNSEKFALARSYPGTKRSAFAFFPGCQLSASYPDYVKRIFTLLNDPRITESEGGVGLVLRCCGAPADWAGRQDVFEKEKAGFLAEYERIGSPRLVLACSSCYQVFKNYFPEVEIVSLWEVLDAAGFPAKWMEFPLHEEIKLAIHDPCSTRYESQIQDSVRSVLTRAGCGVEELPLNRAKTECCSYGGLMWLANPELASAAVQRRIAESPANYVTYCAMCRDFFTRQGKPTLHLLDLFFADDLQQRAEIPGPGYSQRHENRVRLKREMLKQVWGESMESEKPYESIRLWVQPEVQQLLDDRLVLLEDIQQVIQHAEESGRRLLNKKNGHFLAYLQPNAVTYWVEYLPQEDGYQVFNAYCHRMEIGEEGN